MQKSEQGQYFDSLHKEEQEHILASEARQILEEFFPSVLKKGSNAFKMQFGSLAPAGELREKSFVVGTTEYVVGFAEDSVGCLFYLRCITWEENRLTSEEIFLSTSPYLAQKYNGNSAMLSYVIDSGGVYNREAVNYIYEFLIFFETRNY